MTVAPDHYEDLTITEDESAAAVQHQEWQPPGEALPDTLQIVESGPEPTA